MAKYIKDNGTEVKIPKKYIKIIENIITTHKCAELSCNKKVIYQGEFCKKCLQKRLEFYKFFEQEANDLMELYYQMQETLYNMYSEDELKKLISILEKSNDFIKIFNKKMKLRSFT